MANSRLSQTQWWVLLLFMGLVGLLLSFCSGCHSTRVRTAQTWTKRDLHIGAYYDFHYPASWEKHTHVNTQTGAYTTYYTPEKDRGKVEQITKGIALTVHYLPKYLHGKPDFRRHMTHVAYHTFLHLFNKEFQRNDCAPNLDQSVKFRTLSRAKWLLSYRACGVPTKVIDVQKAFLIDIQPEMRDKEKIFKGQPKHSQVCLQHSYQFKSIMEEAILRIHVFAPSREFVAFRKYAQTFVDIKKHPRPKNVRLPWLYLPKRKERFALWGQFYQNPLCSDKERTKTKQELILKRLPAVVNLSYRFKQGKSSKLIPGGTGFIISKSGLVLTNYHAVVSHEDNKSNELIFLHRDRATDPSVRISKKPMEAEPIAAVMQLPRYKDALRTDFNYGRSSIQGHQQYADIALLQIKEQFLSPSLACMPMASAEQVLLGDQVVAIGFPWEGMTLTELGTEVATATIGHVSRLIKMDGWRIFEDLSANSLWINELQHTAKITGGNSGGPLIQAKSGSVVGINTRGGVFDKRIFDNTLLRPALGLGYNYSLPIDLAWQYFPHYLFRPSDKEMDWKQWFELARMWSHNAPQMAFKHALCTLLKMSSKKVEIAAVQLLAAKTFLRQPHQRHLLGHVPVKMGQKSILINTKHKSYACLNSALQTKRDAFTYFIEKVDKSGLYEEEVLFLKARYHMRRAKREMAQVTKGMRVVRILQKQANEWGEERKEKEKQLRKVLNQILIVAGRAIKTIEEVEVYLDKIPLRNYAPELTRRKVHASIAKLKLERLKATMCKVAETFPQVYKKLCKPSSKPPSIQKIPKEIKMMMVYPHLRTEALIRCAHYFRYKKQPMEKRKKSLKQAERILVLAMRENQLQNPFLFWLYWADILYQRIQTKEIEGARNKKEIQKDAKKAIELYRELVDARKKQLNSIFMHKENMSQQRLMELTNIIKYKSMIQSYSTPMKQSSRSMAYREYYSEYPRIHELLYFFRNIVAGRRLGRRKRLCPPLYTKKNKDVLKELVKDFQHYVLASRIHLQKISPEMLFEGGCLATSDKLFSNQTRRLNQVISYWSALWLHNLNVWESTKTNQMAVVPLREYVMERLFGFLRQKSTSKEDWSDLLYAYLTYARSKAKVHKRLFPPKMRAFLKGYQGPKEQKLTFQTLRYLLVRAHIPLPKEVVFDLIKLTLTTLKNRQLRHLQYLISDPAWIKKFKEEMNKTKAKAKRTKKEK